MSRLTDLLSQLAESNPDLANDLRRETDVLSRRRPFGLNFERHIPETVQLPNRRVRRGDKVVFRSPRGESDGHVDSRTWIVTGFEGAGDDRQATLILPEPSEEPVTTTRKVDGPRRRRRVPRPDLSRAFGSTGTVERAATAVSRRDQRRELPRPRSAARSLTAGTVDCIYIDPPYNTGDKRLEVQQRLRRLRRRVPPQKWLAMMERRLQLAKELLNPDDSALIVTIDEKEVLAARAAARADVPRGANPDGHLGHQREGRGAERPVLTRRRVPVFRPVRRRAGPAMEPQHAARSDDAEDDEEEPLRSHCR